MYRRSRITNAYTRNGRIANPTELNVLEKVLEMSQKHPPRWLSYLDVARSSSVGFAIRLL